MSSVPKVAPKQPYQRPNLKIYGNIETLTRVVGISGSATDNGGMATVPNKTH